MRHILSEPLILPGIKAAARASELQDSLADRVKDGQQHVGWDSLSDSWAGEAEAFDVNGDAMGEQFAATNTKGVYTVADQKKSFAALWRRSVGDIVQKQSSAKVFISEATSTPNMVQTAVSREPSMISRGPSMKVSFRHVCIPSRPSAAGGHLPHIGLQHGCFRPI
eukprot:4206637-Pleurochrysis_carterae.AAC.2